METKGRAPIELFLLKYWPTLVDAAEALGVTYQAVRAWKEDKPRNAFKYTLEIVALTGCDPYELYEAVKANVDYIEE